MRITVIICGALLVACGCSTTQVARLDTTRERTQAIEFYKDRTALVGKAYREIAYLASSEPVTQGNYTKELGKLMDQARKLGADALVLDTDLNDQTIGTVFRATAIIYEPEPQPATVP